MDSPKLFIAASHTDNAWVIPFAKELIALGYDVWHDALSLGPVPNFTDFTDRVGDAIQGRDIVVVLSPTSVDSPWVQLEVNFALANGARILPVLHAPTQVTGILATRQYLDVIGVDPSNAAHSLAQVLRQADPAPVIITNPDEARIFLSHSSRDNTATKRVEQDLRQAGVSLVWVDYNEITHGDFYMRINDGLSKCNWLVLIVSPHSLASDREVIQREVNAAMGMISTKEMHDVITFVIEPFDIRMMPPLWRNLQHYDATKGYDDAIQGLLHALGLPK